MVWVELWISHSKFNLELQYTLYDFGLRWENGLLAFFTWMQDICISIFEICVLYLQKTTKTGDDN